VRATELSDQGVAPVRPARIEVELLKAITKVFVIRNPTLGTLQAGQRAIIHEMFVMFLRAARRGDFACFPTSTMGLVKEELAGVPHSRLRQAEVRAVVDSIASMAEIQLVRTHQRLTGRTLGPLIDPAVN
jgi:dGTP triphosphohydrolase